MKTVIYISKELYRSMKKWQKRDWKFIFVYNASCFYWQIQKYLIDDNINVEYVLKNIGAKYKVIYTSSYIYYVISEVEG